MSSRAPLSLRTRLILLFLAAELVLLGGYSWANYIFTRNQWRESFDQVLAAHAESVAGVAELEHGYFELELSPEMTQYFERDDSPDLFTVLHADGRRLAGSVPLEELPKWVAPAEKRGFRDFEFKGHAYRGIIFTATLDEDSDLHAAQRQVVIFYAASRHALDERLAASRRYVLFALPCIFALSAGLVLWIVRLGLAPLGAFARRTAQLDEHSLSTRFSAATYPAELHPLVAAFNSVLAGLQSAFEREQQFSSDAAHELRTPLATLKAGIQAALLCPRNPEEDNRAFHDLLVEVQRLEELCEALLETGCAHDADGETTLSYYDFIEVLELTRDSLAPLAAGQGSELELELPATPPQASHVRATEMHARRILLNLLGNALNHGGAGVKVAIIVTHTAGVIEVAVEDTGPGVPPAAHEFLFRRLFKADSSRTLQTSGAGLGLALSRRLAEQCGGSLRYEAAPSGGSRFVWSVPLAPPVHI